MYLLSNMRCFFHCHCQFLVFFFLPYLRKIHSWRPKKSNKQFNEWKGGWVTHLTFHPFCQVMIWWKSSNWKRPRHFFPMDVFRIPGSMSLGRSPPTQPGAVGELRWLRCCQPGRGSQNGERLQKPLREAWKFRSFSWLFLLKNSWVFVKTEWLKNGFKEFSKILGRQSSKTTTKWDRANW